MIHAEVPPATLEGWYVLHQLFRLDWPGVKRWSSEEAASAGRELAELLNGWADPAGGGWSASYRVVGGQSDFLLLHFRSDLEGLGTAERALQRTSVGDHLLPISDYLSVVELGLYGLTAEVAERFRERDENPSPEAWRKAVEAELETQRELAYVRRRLQPTQPEDMPYLCFYPMDKRRSPGQNWYTLPLGERSEMMHEHGNIGRRFADRISQVISGSIGLDDWEWAVTLFGRDPLDFKSVVTEMRYDRASAVFADFGPFVVGRRMDADEWLRPEAW